MLYVEEAFADQRPTKTKKNILIKSTQKSSIQAEQKLYKTVATNSKQSCKNTEKTHKILFLTRFMIMEAENKSDAISHVRFAYHEMT